MRTTLELPEDILNEVLNVTKAKKKSEAVRIALKDFIRQRKLEKLIKLSGKVEIKDTTEELEKAEIDER